VVELNLDRDEDSDLIREYVNHHVGNQLQPNKFEMWSRPLLTVSSYTARHIAHHPSCNHRVAFFSYMPDVTSTYCQS
jgi:hypothetical protein